MYKQIMPVTLWCSLSYTKNPYYTSYDECSITLDQKPKIQIYCTTIWPSKLEKSHLKSANTEEDNKNGAQQTLKIEM